jgi:hypothetical protein
VQRLLLMLVPLLAILFPLARLLPEVIAWRPPGATVPSLRRAEVPGAGNRLAHARRRARAPRSRRLDRIEQ